ncbi:MAG TPA: GNAT family N-acetyltransferase [Anaerolineales bacterium]
MHTYKSATPISIRHAEPSDYEAVHKIFTGPKAIRGTLQTPFPSMEKWRQRLATPSEGHFSLIACAEEEVVGQLGLHTFPNRPRRRHVAQIGMAVRDDWQGKGVGSALMQAAINLAENWLQITRLELEVYTDNQAGFIFTRNLASKLRARCDNTPFEMASMSTLIAWQSYLLSPQKKLDNHSEK